MDAHWLDALARALTQTQSRRAAVATVMGLLGGVGLVAPDGAQAGRGCKHPCGECSFCKRGKCRTSHGKKTCQRSRCREQPDGTLCTGGTCFVGSCFPTA